MKYVGNPNLPLRAAKVIVVDGRIGRKMEEALARMEIETVKTEPYPGLYPAISYHPDIMLHHLGEDSIMYAPGTAKELLEKLEQKGLQLLPGQHVLTSSYPGNIAYNVCRVGRYAFHNLKYTDPVLRDELMKRGIELVHVKQGYAKCSVSVVNENSIITSDVGIAKAAAEHKLEVLFIQPEEEIRLYELNHGFIGGSTGMISQSQWAIAGNVDHLNSAEEIRGFLAARGIKVVSLYNGPIMDIGTLIPVLQQG